MTYRRSVSRKLARGLALVGLVGALLLLAAVVFFYSLTFDDLTAQDALIHAAREMLKHVALPVIVLMVPVAFVVRRVIRQAFGSVEEAETAIDAARGPERGLRLGTTHIRSEEGRVGDRGGI